MTALLQPVKPMPHGVQIQHHLPSVLGQTTGPHSQQARLDLRWLVRHLMAAAGLVVRQLQTIERAGGSQGNTPVRRIEAILSQGIAFVAGGGQQRVQPQSLVVVKVFVPKSQTIDALREHLLHRMIHTILGAPVGKAACQRLRQSQARVHLAQQQGASIAGKGASRKIGGHPARTQIGEKQRLILRGGSDFSH